MPECVGCGEHFIVDEPADRLDPLHWEEEFDDADVEEFDEFDPEGLCPSCG